MCAILGFVADGSERMNMEAIEAMIAANIHRGRHAFGFAWIDSRGRLRCFKQPGSLIENKKMLNLMIDARAMVLHLRHATHGAPAENVNNHPHPCDAGWIIHNGYLVDYEELMFKHDLWPSSQCDSEVIGLLIEESKEKTLSGRITDALSKIAISSPIAMIGLWKHHLVAARRGNPLSVGKTIGGLYLATLPEGLPGEVESLKLGDQLIVNLSREGTIREVQKVANAA